MRIVRTGVLVLCIFVAGSVTALCLQAVPESTPAPASANAPTASSQTAYHLPPEKLAKAIALSRIRDIEHFVDAFWGFAVLWLLLSTRTAAGLEAWAVGVFKKR